MDKFETLHTDVLVIGSGGAALRAALAAHDAGVDVLVAVKGKFGKSGASYYSVAEVGAFNVGDGAGDPEDTPDGHYRDIETAALGMADLRLSRILADEAERAMRDLESFGVEFERRDGKYLVYQACFSNRPRSHVIKNHFKPIVKALGEELLRRGVPVMEHIMVTNLIVRDGECLGAYAIDAKGTHYVIRAKSTVLTVGGASHLFNHNLYPPDITGDGYAAAFRAGARLTNMEFMQAGVSVISPFINLFNNFLWEAPPRLTNRWGETFLEKYLDAGISAEQAIRMKAGHFPFSARDESRYIEIAIHKEIQSGNAFENGGIAIDFRDVDFKTALADRNSGIGKMWPITYEWYKERKADLYNDSIYVVCSAHAVNGGVLIGPEAESSIKGLYAAGEVASGPHGADRLGGNMSVTCQVFGRRAGENAGKRAKALAAHPPVRDLFQEERAYLDQFKGTGKAAVNTLKRKLQQLSDRYLLIVRNEQGLNTYLREVETLREQLRCETALTGARDLLRALELDNLLETGRLMASAALLRKESRGSHYREDYPAMDPAYDLNIIADRNAHETLFVHKLNPA